MIKAQGLRQQQRAFGSGGSGSSGGVSSPLPARRRRALAVVPRAMLQEQQQQQLADLARRAGAGACALLLAASAAALPAAARPEGVNRPELLPTQPTPVIDVAAFLTPFEERRIADTAAALERDTGIKLRVLAQSYPETPGLAIREFWGVDDSTVVFVADPTFGDILNFNVGQAVDLEVPRSFWSRLAGKLGNKFYWQEKGEAAAIMGAVDAIDHCLREPQGRARCSTVEVADKY